jgi:hypothetical protein
MLRIKIAKLQPNYKTQNFTCACNLTHDMLTHFVFDLLGLSR